jgi:hypothetical protein
MDLSLSLPSLTLHKSSKTLHEITYHVFVDSNGMLTMTKDMHREKM